MKTLGLKKTPTALEVFIPAGHWVEPETGNGFPERDTTIWLPYSWKLPPHISCATFGERRFCPCGCRTYGEHVARTALADPGEFDTRHEPPGRSNIRPPEDATERMVQHLLYVGVEDPGSANHRRYFARREGARLKFCVSEWVDGEERVRPASRREVIRSAKRALPPLPDRGMRNGPPKPPAARLTTG